MTGRAPLSSARGGPPTRTLELGLILIVLSAPIPFGAVTQRGRLALELGALLLVALWTLCSLLRPVVLPPRVMIAGVLGLVGLALVQALPVGSSLVGVVSPVSEQIRSDSQPRGPELEAERGLIQLDPRELDASSTLSVDPRASASALRTGAALAGLFFVAVTVGATCGLRRLATALLAAASLQGLYGLVVLASENPYLLYLPKRFYLDSATGTFVNRNHFAAFLVMGLTAGLALLLDNARRMRRSGNASLLLLLFRGDNGRNLLLGLMLVVGLAGLLASFSRAGIALGLAALLATLLAAGRRRTLRMRFVVAALLLAAAALPLFQLGADRLGQRYAQATTDLLADGGRAVVWSDTLRIAAAFPVAGSGFGTFSATYPLYRSPEVRMFYAHAHNDAIQAAAEGGIPALICLGLLLGPLLVRVIRGLSGTYGLPAVGFAAGLAAVLLHALVDFNFHIPANAATAAILAGCLTGVSWNARS